MNLMNLFAQIFLKTEDFEKGLKDSEKKGKSWQSSMSVVFKGVAKAVSAVAGAISVVSGAIVSLSTKSIDFGDDIDKTSQKLGISSTAYQKWALAAEMAGSEVSNLQTAIRQLTKFTQDLSKGQGDALLALQELGIEYEEFMDMDFEEQLKTVVEGMQGLENQTDKTRLAQKIFGDRAYQELLPLLNQEKGSIDKLFKSYEDLGLVVEDDVTKSMSEMNDIMSLTKRAFQVLGANATYELSPSLKLIMNGFLGIANGSEEATTDLVDGFLGIADKVIEYAPELINKTSDLLINVIDGLVPKLPKLAENLLNVVEKLLLKISEPETILKLTGTVFEIVGTVFKKLIDLDWSTIITNLTDIVFGVVYGQLPQFALNIFSTLLDLFTTPEGLEKLGKISVAITQAIINGIITGIESGLNLVVDSVNKITGSISKLWKWAGVPEIKELERISLPRIELYAGGGMLDNLFDFTKQIGSVAVMGENGAEIVATGTRGTGVANIEQIAEAQYEAMEDYDVKSEIRRGVAEIVNAIFESSRIAEITQNNYSRNNNVIRSGSAIELLILAINEELRKQGRKTLYTI